MVKNAGQVIANLTYLTLIWMFLFEQEIEKNPSFIFSICLHIFLPCFSFEHDFLKKILCGSPLLSPHKCFYETLAKTLFTPCLICSQIQLEVNCKCVSLAKTKLIESWVFCPKHTLFLLSVL